LWSNDNDVDACNTFRWNFKHTLFECDIRGLNLKELPKVDVITAGFPCQPFSLAGNREGLKSAEGKMFFQILKVMKKLKPKVVLMENVKNIQLLDKGKTLKKILRNIKDNGYYVKFQEICTAEYTQIPQTRRRVFFVCHLQKSQSEKFKFPEPVNSPLPITDFFDKFVEKHFWFSEKKAKKFVKIIKEDNVMYKDGWYKKIYKLKQNLAPTITCSQGNLTVFKKGKRFRTFTPSEELRLQGFPENFYFPVSQSRKHELIGNAVSVPVIKLLAEAIKKSLK